mmetsp:Transcript_37633/g.111666  ORF Transcript_37633/g.111666 Transcript_37633/m.111666 type:complete len:257 (-) Transcript_37633:166-936(-)
MIRSCRAWRKKEGAPSKARKKPSSGSVMPSTCFSDSHASLQVSALSEPRLSRYFHLPLTASRRHSSPPPNASGWLQLPLSSQKPMKSMVLREPARSWHITTAGPRCSRHSDLMGRLVPLSRGQISGSSRERPKGIALCEASIRTYAAASDTTAFPTLRSSRCSAPSRARTTSGAAAVVSRAIGMFLFLPAPRNLRCSLRNLSTSPAKASLSTDGTQAEVRLWNCWYFATRPNAALPGVLSCPEEAGETSCEKGLAS